MMVGSVTSLRAGPGACLDDLLASRFLPRSWASRIWSASKLPSRLKSCVNNLAPGSEWRAYGKDERILFAIARSHADEQQADPGLAIDVYFLDDNASVYSAAVWEHDTDHGWWQDAVIEVSYDCEYGWWLDGLMLPKNELQPAGARPRLIAPAAALPAARPARAALAAVPKRRASDRRTPDRRALT